MCANHSRRVMLNVDGGRTHRGQAGKKFTVEPQHSRVKISTIPWTRELWALGPSCVPGTSGDHLGSFPWCCSIHSTGDATWASHWHRTIYQPTSAEEIWRPWNTQFLRAYMAASFFTLFSLGHDVLTLQLEAQAVNLKRHFFFKGIKKCWM